VPQVEAVRNRASLHRCQQLTRRASLIATLLLVMSATEVHAQGWYLMIPPLLEGGRLSLDAPLSTWTQLQAFDSVGRCESERTLWGMFARAKDDAGVEAAAHHFLFSNGPPPAMRPDQWEAAKQHAQTVARVQAEYLRKNPDVARQVMQAQCVSVADPRLVPRK